MRPLIEFCRALEVIAQDPAASDQAGKRVAAAMRSLVSDDGWLLEPWAAPSAERYQQHLLYLDPQHRFSVVSFVWGPGQETPIHDHGGLWGVVGVLRGAELSTRYTQSGDGSLAAQAPDRLDVCAIDVLDPAAGDIHAVANALPDAVSVSIHAYGGDIGSVQRRAFDPDGTAKPFVSRYSSQEAMLGELVA